MAKVPLLSDQDVEMGGGLPNYDDIENFGEKKTNSGLITNSRTPNSNNSNNNDTNTNSTNNLPLGGLFSKNLDEHGEGNSNAVAFANLAIRLGFLRKVLGILSFQFAVTVAFCTVLYLTPVVRGFIQQQVWIVLVSSLSSIGVLFAMFIHARTVPLNYFLLGAWTILQALSVGTIVTFYDAEIVLQAVFLTSVVVISLFIYTLQSKRDFHKFYAILMTLSMVLISAMLLQLFIASPIFNLAVSVGGAGLFSLYLIFDIDMIMHYHSEEDYILACISIYMDIMGLFLRILEILNELNRS